MMSRRDPVNPRFANTCTRRRASCAATRKRLFGGAGAGGRGHAVLLPGAAARPDRADDLAVDDDRNAAFRCHRSLGKGHEGGVARGILIREALAWTTEHDRRARLALSNLRRSHLSPVHLLKIDEL